MRCQAGEGARLHVLPRREPSADLCGPPFVLVTASGPCRANRARGLGECLEVRQAACVVFKRVSGECRCPSGCQARCLCICVGEATARKLVSFADPQTRDGVFLFSPGLIPARRKRAPGAWKIVYARRTCASARAPGSAARSRVPLCFKPIAGRDAARGGTRALRRCAIALTPTAAGRARSGLQFDLLP